MAVIVEFSVRISGNIRKEAEDHQTRFWAEFEKVLKSRAIRAGRRAVGIDSGNLRKALKSQPNRGRFGFAQLRPIPLSVAAGHCPVALAKRGAAPHPSPQRALDAVVKRNLSRWVKAAEAEANRRIN